MRTVYVTALLFLAFLSNAVAQTEKGRWLVGAQVGDLAYRKMKNDLGNNFTVSLTPSVGYFLVKNLSIGVVVPVTVNNSDLGYSASYFSRSVGIGPSIQYYVGNVNVKPFVGLGYTYNWNYTKWSDPNPANESVSKGYDDNLTPSAGVAFFFNRNVLLSAGLS
ncbi:outer membrane beta-barrel protein [Larkinella insperata]|uniref:Outer membrane beta-barrel protein n=1 Tax=Larkinella insperata TaxID=332158 RepID=A0ABW3Q8Q7_9BACT|nr:outer membrane beta-barrel protein [Larkinella insperata]